MQKEKVKEKWSWLNGLSKTCSFFYSLRTVLNSFNCENEKKLRWLTVLDKSLGWIKHTRKHTYAHTLEYIYIKVKI